jgi:hypothetical protein
MDSAKVNGVELEYEVVGAGEPVLLSSPLCRGAFCRSCPNRRWPTATA